MIILALALVVLLLTSLYVNYLFLNNVVDTSPNQKHSRMQGGQSYEYESRKEHDQGFRETSSDEDDQELEAEYMRVAIMDGQAFWVSGNEFVTAPLDETGRVKREDKVAVNVDSLTDAQVKRMMDILDALKEDEDEGSDPGE